MTESQICDYKYRKPCNEYGYLIPKVTKKECVLSRITPLITIEAKKQIEKQYKELVIKVNT